MAQLTKEWIDRQESIAENTWVAQTASGVIVISHPSQKPPDPKDRKYLRENFGLLPEVEIMPLSETEHAPPIERLRRELALQDSPIADRMAYHKREFVRLSLEDAAGMGMTVTPAVARAAEAELEDAAAEARADGDGDGDGDEQSVGTVGGRRKSVAKE